MTLDTSNVPEPVTEIFEEGDVQLSEVKMHFTVYGEDGYPLILVHGNGGSQDSLREAAQYLANDYKVYLIESRCHGQSTDPGEISYDLMAKDIKEFIEFPLRLYKGVYGFVPPLYTDEKKLLLSGGNSDTAESVFFLAKRDGKTVDFFGIHKLNRKAKFVRFCRQKSNLGRF
jgi:hypothetical protein